MQDPSNLAVRLSSPPNTATKVVSVEDSKTSKVANSASSRMAKVESKVAKVANPAYNKKVKLHGEGAEAGKLIYSAPDIKVKQISDTNSKMSRSEKLEPRKVSKHSAGKTDIKVTDLQSKEGNWGLLWPGRRARRSWRPSYISARGWLSSWRRAMPTCCSIECQIFPQMK